MRIFWTEDEKRVLINRLIEIRKSGVWPGNAHALRQAQEALASDRRRKITGSVVHLSKPMLQKSQEEYLEYLSALQAAKATAQLPADRGLGRDLEALVDRVVEKVVARLMRELTPLLKPAVAFDPELARTNTKVREDLQSPEPQVRAMRKVLIVGLIPPQVEALHASYEVWPALYLRFMDTAEATTHSIPSNLDTVILMTKFISHAAQNRFRNYPVKYCNGGVSDLRILLNGLNQS